jgi:hypothetical protein
MNTGLCEAGTVRVHGFRARLCEAPRNDDGNFRSGSEERSLEGRTMLLNQMKREPDAKLRHRLQQDVDDFLVGARFDKVPLAGRAVDIKEDLNDQDHVHRVAVGR